jgi:hypothetical protein
VPLVGGGGFAVADAYLNDVNKVAQVGANQFDSGNVWRRCLPRTKALRLVMRTLRSSQGDIYRMRGIWRGVQTIAATRPSIPSEVAKFRSGSICYHSAQQMTHNGGAALVQAGYAKRWIVFEVRVTYQYESGAAEELSASIYCDRWNDPRTGPGYLTRYPSVKWAGSRLWATTASLCATICAGETAHADAYRGERAVRHADITIEQMVASDGALRRGLELGSPKGMIMADMHLTNLQPTGAIRARYPGNRHRRCTGTGNDIGLSCQGRVRHG